MVTGYCPIQKRNFLLGASHFLNSPPAPPLHILVTPVLTVYLIVTCPNPQHPTLPPLAPFLGHNYLAPQPKRACHIIAVRLCHHLLVPHIQPTVILLAKSFTVLPSKFSERTWTRCFSACTSQTVSIACAINCTGTKSWKGGPFC